MTHILCMLAGYTIHTVVALAHAGLIPLEHQQAVQQAFQQCSPLLSTTPDTLTALMDKSLPTMIGLGGNSLPILTLILPFVTSVNGQVARYSFLSLAWFCLSGSLFDRQLPYSALFSGVASEVVLSSYPRLDPAFWDPYSKDSFPIHPLPMSSLWGGSFLLSLHGAAFWYFVS